MTRDDFCFISLGLLDAMRETGKTGEIELALPPVLFEAVNNYCMVKEAMFGSPGGEKVLLFVSHDNKAISMHNTVQAKLFTSIWEIMGTKMTARDKRIVMVTKIRDQNLTGNTGMQHSVQMQEHTYQSTRANEGVRNKLAVNKEV